MRVSRRQQFGTLCENLFRRLRETERLVCTFSGEESVFCRLNRGLVRQVGNVLQGELGIALIDGQRLVRISTQVSGDHEEDVRRGAEALAQARETLRWVAEDPYLNYNTGTSSLGERGTRQSGGEVSWEDMVHELLRAGAGCDLVGFVAVGRVDRGVCSSTGVDHWFEQESFNVDWSLYLRGDRAVKSRYAGKVFRADELDGIMQRARADLKIMERSPRTLVPGGYDVFLAPQAVSEIFNLLNWGAFGAKSQQTKQSPLMRLVQGEAVLSQSVDLAENTADGVAPGFDDWGFSKPGRTDIVRGGRFVGSMVSARSAKEFGLACNGAGAGEGLESLDLAAGNLEEADVLRRLGRGLWINNLWYLNYSDRNDCRMTGMTRFAAFWVDGGEIVEPVAVMRFDESFYRLLGSQLDGLTRERRTILSADTYGARSCESMTVPGALVRDFRLTL